MKKSEIGFDSIRSKKIIIYIIAIFKVFSKSSQKSSCIISLLGPPPPKQQHFRLHNRQHLKIPFKWPPKTISSSTTIIKLLRYKILNIPFINKIVSPCVLTLTIHPANSSTWQQDPTKGFMQKLQYNPAIKDESTTVGPAERLIPTTPNNSASWCWMVKGICGN